MANAIVVMRVYTTSATWTKPERLQRIDVLVRGAGGAGNADIGGGGGAAVHVERIRPADLGATVAVVIGSGGTSGGDGQQSIFGEIVAPGGMGGNNGNSGGVVAGMRGGSGGASGQPGGSATSGPVRLLAAGGGGAGLGSTGGKSGIVPANTGYPIFWQWCQSGSGGNSGQPGGFPSGGGGANAAGAAGVVTVIEYLSPEI